MTVDCVRYDCTCPATADTATHPHWRVHYRDAHDRSHRVDGPAVLNHDGRTQWYRHGNFHRLDGPAVEPPTNPVPRRDAPPPKASWWVEGRAQDPQVVIDNWLDTAHPDATPPLRETVHALASPWPRGSSLADLYAAAAAAHQ